MDKKSTTYLDETNSIESSSNDESSNENNASDNILIRQKNSISEDGSLTFSIREGSIMSAMPKIKDGQSLQAMYTNS